MKDGKEFHVQGSNYTGIIFGSSVMSQWRLVGDKVNVNAPVRRVAGSNCDQELDRLSVGA